MSQLTDRKIFVVGAGGIGCELLKNLVLSGFRKIDVIDLDTVDLSNLNRQFLFRRRHIGQSKAKVAAEAVSAMAAGVEIVAHHASVKHADFGPEFVRRFDLVINALDNLDARRHVNRLCLAAGVPLLESATEGYMGYATAIFPRESECFECAPKAAPKGFAVCTIRTNPTEPIHCIHWSKMLFARLWGVRDDANAISELPQPQSASAPVLFDKVFDRDIRELASMEKLWTGRAPPKPLTFDDACRRTDEPPRSVSPAPAIADQALWGVAECAKRFARSFAEVEARSAAAGRAPITWDKDDPASLDFVTASANLRAFVFGIPATSRFDVKAKAGNIVPAIATSNAIIAGLLASEAIKIVTGRKHLCRPVHLSTNPDRLLVVRQLEPPNPACYVCGHHYLTVKAGFATTTVGAFVHVFLRKVLGFNDPTVILGSDIIYECGEGLEDSEREHYAAMERKTLEVAKFVSNSPVEIKDFSQDLSVTITVINSAGETKPATGSELTEEDTFAIVGGRVPDHADEVRKENEQTLSTKAKSPEPMEITSEPDVIMEHVGPKHSTLIPPPAGKVVILDD